MRSLNLKFIESIRLSPRQASALKKIGEYKGMQALFARQTPEVLESLRRVARIESNESSNRIEGVTAPPDRVRALVLDDTKPRDRSEQEIAGYRDVLETIHDSGDYMALSIHSIKQLHAKMYSYQPEDGGQWKHVDNKIIESNPDGSIKEIRFEPVAAAETEGTMEELVRDYDLAINQYHLEPLIVIPLTILDFLCIHPFLDGNGRMSRLLTLLLLYHADIQVGRFISLERVIEDSKATYYESLKASSQKWHEGAHDPYPWINYFWGILLKAYHEFEERVGEIRSKKLSKTEQIRMAIERKVGLFAISEIEEECPHISRDMIKLVLRDLRDAGVITVQGKGRGARWIRTADKPQKVEDIS
ncbi:MAG: Fic family protein [Candidatus Krumholzibacteria bacterium]|nr:Fic family protein [Candidatus Krumholzibacteria bacterium]